ncbi:MAG: hypothetical protein AAF488_01835 [Planctomycetota bacterium]
MSSRRRVSWHRSGVILFFFFILFGLIIAGAPRASGDVASGPDYTSLPPVSLAGFDPVDADPYGFTLHPTLPLGYVAHAGTPAFMDPELFNGSTVSEIDLETGTVVRSFSVGLFPTDLAITSDGSELFVVTSTGGTLGRIDLGSGAITEVAIVDSMLNPVGFPSSLALSPDESQIFVTSNGSSFDGSSENLIVFDRPTLTVVDTVTIVGGLGRIAVRSDGRVVVPVGFPDDVFPSFPQVRVYDSTVTGWAQLASIELDVDTADFPAPIDVALDPTTNVAYVTVLGGSNELFRIDVETLSLLPPWSLPGTETAQNGVTVDNESGHVVITDFNAQQARVLDGGTGAVIATIVTGDQPNEVVVGAGRIWITSQLAEQLDMAILPGAYVRGEANGDGVVDIADAVTILAALFSGGMLDCEDAADLNDDGVLDLADPIGLFSLLFSTGTTPSYPYGCPGADVTLDALGCDR